MKKITLIVLLGASLLVSAQSDKRLGYSLEFSEPKDGKSKEVTFKQPNGHFKAMRK